MADTTFVNPLDQIGKNNPTETLNAQAELTAKLQSGLAAILATGAQNRATANVQGHLTNQNTLLGSHIDINNPDFRKQLETARMAGITETLADATASGATAGLVPNLGQTGTLADLVRRGEITSVVPPAITAAQEANPNKFVDKVTEKNKFMVLDKDGLPMTRTQETERAITTKGTPPPATPATPATQPIPITVEQQRDARERIIEAFPDADPSTITFDGGGNAEFFDKGRNEIMVLDAEQLFGG